MLELSKRKRMMIMEQITDKKDRMPSAERRKIVQEEYNKFVKTMSNFNVADKQSLNNSLVNKTVDFNHIKTQFSKDALPPFFTPTVKDISPSPKQIQNLSKQFYEGQSSAVKQNLSFSPDKMNQINFYKKQLAEQNKQNVNLSNLNEQHSSHRDSQPNIEDQQIKVPDKNINVSAKSDSNNNSQAIFFTSQFKDFINKQAVPNEQIVEKEQQTQKSEPKPQPTSPQHNQKWDERLNSNASGRSLAFSNQSSLKYSLNQSAIQDLISKKLSNQLVIESMGNSHIFHNLIRISMSLSLKDNIADVIIFGKQYRLVQLITKNKVISVYDSLIFNKEYIFELKKNQIKADHFKAEKEQILIKASFDNWKSQMQEKKIAVSEFIVNRDSQIKSKIFRSFKVLLFDRRINNQVEMYYLSKLFFAFKNVTDKQSKKINQKAYKLYIKNLKKRTFSLLLQGKQNMQRERQTTEIAHQNYYFTLIRKCFKGWKQLNPRQQKYICLSMTTKNVLKESPDHRLLQTRTFDFHEKR